MSWNKALSDLQFHLASLFPLKDDIIPIVGRAGLPLASLEVSDKGIIFWYTVLSEARQRGLLDELIAEARRLYPNDGVLTSFNALLIDEASEIRFDVLKDLCAEILREGQFRGALPILEEIVVRSPAGPKLEVDLITRSAQLHRHLRDAELQTGRKKKQALRFIESSKSDLIALMQAL